MVNLHHLGVHVIKNPAGTYSFVGTLPSVLGTIVEATTLDVMAGRAFKDGARFVVVKFPTFPTREAAVAHAASRGVAVRPEPSGATMQALADQTTAEGRKAVKKGGRRG